MKFAFITVLLLLLCFGKAVGQSKTYITYNFEDTTIKEDVILRNWGSFGAKTFIKITHADSSFTNCNLFHVLGDSCHFQVKDDTWLIKRNKAWEIFYSPNSIKPQEVFRGEYTLWVLKPLYKDTIYSIPCIVYNFYDINSTKRGYLNIPSPYKCYYWFSPQLGFIRIQIDGVNLLRSDVRRE